MITLGKSPRPVHHRPHVVRPRGGPIFPATTMYAFVEPPAASAPLGCVPLPLRPGQTLPHCPGAWVAEGDRICCK